MNKLLLLITYKVVPVLVVGIALLLYLYQIQQTYDLVVKTYEKNNDVTFWSKTVKAFLFSLVVIGGSLFWDVVKYIALRRVEILRDFTRYLGCALLSVFLYLIFAALMLANYKPPFGEAIEVIYPLIFALAAIICIGQTARCGSKAIDVITKSERNEWSDT